MFEVQGLVNVGGLGEIYECDLGFSLWQCLQGLYEANEHELLTVICCAIEFFERTDKNLSENDRVSQILQKGVSNVDFGLPVPVSYANLNITSIDQLRDLFDDLCPVVETKIANLIYTNPNQFITDENGLPFDESFTGIYENCESEVGYILPMKNGKPHGKFEVFDKIKTNWVGEFDNGFLKSQSYVQFFDIKRCSRFEFEYEPYEDTSIVIYSGYYVNSTQIKKQERYIVKKDSPKIGIQKKWYENGQIEAISDYFDPLNHRVNQCEIYYENGQLKFKGLKNFFDIIHGEWYYEDGKKWQQQFFDEKGYQHITKWSKEGVVILYSAFDHYGKYIEHRSFYPNGNKKAVYLEYTSTQKPNFRYGEWLKEMRQAWDENGNQTVIDGNGIISEIESWNGCLNTYEYQNGLLRIHTEFYDTGEKRCETYFNDDKKSYIHYEKDGSVEK